MAISFLRPASFHVHFELLPIEALFVALHSFRMLVSANLFAGTRCFSITSAGMIC